MALARLKGRLTKLLDGEPAPDNLHFFTDWPLLDQGGLARLSQWLDIHPHVQAGPHRHFAESQASRRCATKPLCGGLRRPVRFAETCTGPEVGRSSRTHTRKASADDVFDTVNGSTGLNRLR